MKLAETITFGGSGADTPLERDAHLRDEAQAMWASPDARVLPFWHGLPLVRAADEGWQAVWLPCDHPILRDALAPGSAPVFLGREAGAPRFALALADWPDAPKDTADGSDDMTAPQHPDLPQGDVFVDLRRIMAGLSPRDAGAAATGRAVLEWHRRHGFCANCGTRTQPAQAGWLRKCPACNRTHFPHIEPVAIMLVTHGNSVLVGRSPGWRAGMYSLLAGFIEPGETVEAAVRREVFEETGVQIGAVRYLASQPWPFPASLMIGCHGTAIGREITMDPVEIEDALWLTREQLMQVFAGNHSDIQPAREGSIAHFLLRNWLADRLD